MKVLLIEDDLEYAYLIQEMLAAAGDASFDLKHADQLSTGREQLRTGTFDLILLDLSLPDSYGVDTFVKVRNQTPDVPIIVLSGLDNKSLTTRIMQAGAQDYLIKGQIDAHMLAHAIRHTTENEKAKKTQNK
jgi:two-component system cell cycle sensor histidine kinase/response regulator CckA